ncbi:MAG: lipoprotein-releasing ABC transporter permease subunit [Holosporales bacterium]|jgi:lipoprotein-releasing system permease protein|nr:lipoprotein-releasing ABC transporter permease subunit [Holosporales bacterium]
MIERLIAMRYLSSRKGSGFAYVVTWFSFIGIALGVATLIIVTSVMNGFREELLEKIVGMKGHIIVLKTSHIGISEYETLASKIRSSDNEIEQVIPQIERQIVLISNGNPKGVLVHGLSKESLKSKTLISKNIVSGEIEKFSGQGVFIGKRLADVERLHIGDFLKILVPDGLITPFGKLPKEEQFEVLGIFEIGMSEYDKNIILMPLEAAQSLFDFENRVSQIEIFLKNVDKSERISKKLANEIESEFSIFDWKHSDSSIFHAVVVEKNVMTLILSIIVLVAVFNIISGLTMLTNSKIKDIAILRTIGLTRRSILKIFFLIGSLVGVLGTSVGVILGITVSLNIDKIKQFLEQFADRGLFSEEIYFLSQIPSKTDWNEVFCIILFSILLCLLATIYPARKASKLEPAEALRI